MLVEFGLDFILGNRDILNGVGTEQFLNLGSLKRFLGHSEVIGDVGGDSLVQFLFGELAVAVQIALDHVIVGLPEIVNFLLIFFGKLIETELLGFGFDNRLFGELINDVLLGVRNDFSIGDVNVLAIVLAVVGLHLCKI